MADTNAWMDEIQYNADGLVPAIVQEWETGEVLMLAYMNAESLRLSVETRKATYFSRSRQKLWVKGETSGHFQTIRMLSYDCDADTLLLQVSQEGAACHTGEHSCFYRQALPAETKAPSPQVLLDEYATILSRKAKPVEDSYTTYLFENGIDKICKKVGEEATEVVIAAKNNSKEELSYEAADLLYHLLVTMAQIGLSPEELFAEMRRRGE